MFTLPGTPVMRYGDEIGMGDDLRLPERNCVRTPMQWSTEPHGGFTTSDKPVAAGDHRRALWLSSMSTSPTSAAIRIRMLNWIERIIRMRKEVPEIGWGDFAVLSTPATGRCWRCATTGATMPCSSCTISPASRRGGHPIGR